MKTTKYNATLFVLLVMTSSIIVAIEPMGTAFTYQGRMLDNNIAADGLYDMQFSMYDAESNGNQVGLTVDSGDVQVVDGYFIAQLDFGSDPNTFNGDARWLEIGIRPGELADPNAYTTLTPRQMITPTPYALYTPSSGNSVSVPLELSGSVAAPDSVMHAVNSGSGDAIVGLHNDSNSYGVLGSSNIGVIGSGNTHGVVGFGDSVGIFGSNNISSTYGTLGDSDSGVYGYGSTGVWGSGTVGVSGDGSTYGVQGTSAGIGVYGDGSTYGVQGSSDSIGVYGYSIGDTGVYGDGSLYGVYGSGDAGVYGGGNVGVYADGDNYGVLGYGNIYGIKGSSSSTGVYGEGSLYGVYGYNGGGGWAGYFEGNVSTTGDLSVSGALYDSSIDAGTLGQVLSSTGTGTDWIAMNYGDITAVNAGNGLSGGGDTGEVTLAVSVPLSLSGSVASPTAIINGSNSSSGYGVFGSGSTGVYGQGNLVGVDGFSSYTGVHAQGGTYGVYGENSSSGYYAYLGGSTYAGYFSGDVYVTGTMSAATVVDRTPYPKDLETAYEAVMSMERLPNDLYQEDNKEQQLDHSKLNNFIRTDDGHRDLSATVSCQNAVLKDLIKKVEAQQQVIETQNQRIEQLTEMLQTNQNSKSLMAQEK